MLNRMYTSFNPEDGASLPGVTVWMSPTPSLHEDIWCYPDYTPSGKSSCSERTGQTANCQLSASVYNHRVSLDWDKTTNQTINKVSWSEYRYNGLVFNQQLVEENMAKCAYAFDGSSSNRWNSGCGTATCTCENGCYENICCSTWDPADPMGCAPENRVSCSAESPSINGAMCKTASQPESTFRPNADMVSGLPAKRSDAQCFWNMPNLILNSSTAAQNQLRDMLTWRASQSGMDELSYDPIKQTPYKTVQSEWTEIVLDARPLLENLKKNAEKTVLAFVFGEEPDLTILPGAHQITAAQARDSFCKQYGCTDYMPPLVMWKVGQTNFTDNAEYGCGPFYPPTTEADEGVDRCTSAEILAVRSTPSLAQVKSTRRPRRKRPALILEPGQ